MQINKKYNGLRINYTYFLIFYLIGIWALPYQIYKADKILALYFFLGLSSLLFLLFSTAISVSLMSTYLIVRKPGLFLKKKIEYKDVVSFKMKDVYHPTPLKLYYSEQNMVKTIKGNFFLTSQIKREKFISTLQNKIEINN